MLPFSPTLGKSLNLVALKLAAFPPLAVPDLGEALARAGGITIGADTFLVPGEFSDWCFFLAEASGGDERLYKIYSLSAFEGGQQGLQANVRELCRDHLKGEFEKLGIKPPNSL